MNIADRILSKVERIPFSGCWIYLGALNSKGYAWVSRSRSEGPVRGHRAMFEEMHGPIPRGQCILHRCDIPSCVNPEHLFLGSKKDNTHDMIAKGRHSFPPRMLGSAHPKAKLTQEQIEAIESDVRPVKEIALSYKVSEKTIYAVKRGVARCK